MTKTILNQRFTAGVLVAFVAVFIAPLSLTAERPEPNLEVGMAAYQANCARCHGPEGAGDGRDANLMHPKPRNLADGMFKFRSTESGTPPTDEDLFKIITEGLPGSRMPEFERLPEDVRWQLVYVVKSFSEMFEEESVVVPVGTDPGSSDIALGKETYEALGCNTCHGEQGRGNGDSGVGLVDDWEHPIVPANLTQGWSYRAGSEPKDIAQRLLTGLDGTPMPSYYGTIEEGEAWALAYYVHSLQEAAHFTTDVHVLSTQDALSLDANAPFWAQAKVSDFLLSSNIYKEGTVLPSSINAVRIQAAKNERELVLKFNWYDRSSDSELADALSFVLVPHRADKWDIGSVRAWPATADAQALDVTHWSSNNAAAFQEKTTSPVLEDGQGTKLGTVASYDDGLWTLLIKRPLNQITDLNKDKHPLLGVMIWDGGNAESGRHRANSHWINLHLEPKAEPTGDHSAH